MFQAQYPFAFGMVVAFGATCLVAYIAKYAFSKLRPAFDGEMNALLLATGFAWGRFMAIDASGSLEVGGLAGAVAAVVTLWAARRVRGHRST